MSIFTMFTDLKKDFPIFANHPTLAYLDSGATAQVPACVLDAMRTFETETRSNIHRGTYKLSEQATDLYENARAKVAAFIDVYPHEIVFTSGTTDSMNKLAYMFEHSPNVGTGTEIVATIMEHHSAILPFQELARRKGYSFSLIPITENNDFDIEEVRSRITEETRFVVVTLASNVLGTINDIKAIVAHAHSVGALVIVDAAQAVGHIPVSVKELSCDFLVFSGHKMCGPMGIGVLYGRSDILDSLSPGAYGGGMVADVDVDAAIFVEVPHRFEAGTQNITGAIGLAEAVSYLTTLGVHNVQAHTKELTDYAIDVLGNIPGLNLFTQKNTERNVGIVSLTLDGIHPHDIAEVCSRENVAVRAGHHCALPLMKHLGVPGTIRASFYCYTVHEDIDRLAQSIRKVQTIFL